MTGKSVLITGCSSGIGLSVAEGLRGKGYRVFATARKASDVARLTAAGFESLQLDLADPTSIRTAVDDILATRCVDRVINSNVPVIYRYAQPGEKLFRLKYEAYGESIRLFLR